MSTYKKPKGTVPMNIFVPPAIRLTLKKVALERGTNVTQLLITLVKTTFEEEYQESVRKLGDSTD